MGKNKLTRQQKILLEGLRLSNVRFEVATGIINFLQDEDYIRMLTVFMAKIAKETGNMPSEQEIIEALARLLKGEDIFEI